MRCLWTFAWTRVQYKVVKRIPKTFKHFLTVLPTMEGAIKPEWGLYNNKLPLLNASLVIEMKRIIEMLIHILHSIKLCVKLWKSQKVLLSQENWIFLYLLEVLATKHESSYLEQIPMNFFHSFFFFFNWFGLDVRVPYSSLFMSLPWLQIQHPFHLSQSKPGYCRSPSEVTGHHRPAGRQLVLTNKLLSLTWRTRDYTAGYSESDRRDASVDWHTDAQYSLNSFPGRNGVKQSGLKLCGCPAEPSVAHCVGNSLYRCSMWNSLTEQ